MTSQVYHLGADISKATIDCHLLPADTASGRAKNATGTSFRVANTPAGYAALDARLRSKIDTGARVLVTAEATGGYERGLHHALTGAGIPVAIVNPKRIRDFGKALGQLAKTDKLDARLIARYGQTFNPRPTPVPSPARQILRDWLPFRTQLAGEIAARAQQRKAYTDPALCALADEELRHLRAKIKDLDRQIAALLEAPAEPEIAATVQILRSFTGVGPIVAALLIAHLPELGTLNAKQIASLAGLAPFARDSGEKRGIRTIFGGRAPIRHALFTVFRVGLRYNPVIRDTFDRLTAAGKPGKVAMVAAMRKTLVILNAMVKTNTTWRKPQPKAMPMPAAA